MLFSLNNLDIIQEIPYKIVKSKLVLITKFNNVEDHKSGKLTSVNLLENKLEPIKPG